MQRVKRYRPVRQHKGVVPGTGPTLFREAEGHSWHNNSERTLALVSPNRA